MSGLRVWFAGAALLVVWTCGAGPLSLVRVSDGVLTDEVSEGLVRPHRVRTADDMIAVRTNGVHVVTYDRVYADALSIPLHDAGVKTIFDWDGEADVLNAARELGAKYIRTGRPKEATELLKGFAAREKRRMTADEFRVRDPFVLADAATGAYYLYETASPYRGEPYARGVNVRVSKDLVTWSPLKSVLRLSPDERAKSLWAPEVHAYRGRYWLFATVTQYPGEGQSPKPMADDPAYVMPAAHAAGRRGVRVYVSDSPLGPFEPVGDKAITPEGWMCLDGTLVVDSERPYLVFCHEWVQTKVGRMDVAELSPDLTRLVSRPQVLFDALVAPTDNPVTDGPFCYRSKSGKLFMLWSKNIRLPDVGYSVILAESQTGKVTGPWVNHHVIYGRNGGHAMLFKAFDGQLKLALHGPERRGWEHLRLLNVEDTGYDLVVCDELDRLAEKIRQLPQPPHVDYASQSFVSGVVGRVTGHFHVEKHSGRDWLVDPLGRGFVSFGVQSANYGGVYSEFSGRARYKEWNDAHGGYGPWRDQTLCRLKKWGFNTLGHGCDHRLERRGLVHAHELAMGQRLCGEGVPAEYAISASQGVDSGASMPDMFHPAFPIWCDLFCARQVAPYRNDPWTLGWYVDNELKWWGTGNRETGFYDMVVALPETRPARRALEAFVTGRVVTDELKREFLLLAARRYFSVTSAAIRKADPNHLVLGCRFAGVNGAGSPVWQAAGEFCDVVSVNVYPWCEFGPERVFARRNDRISLRDELRRRYELAGKPLVVSEWGFRAMDTGHPNSAGAGQVFWCQRDRARAADMFLAELAAMPFVVGHNFFRWVDQPPEGIRPKNLEDGNYGLVSECGKPYRELTETLAHWQTAPNDFVRSHGLADRRWRESKCAAPHVDLAKLLPASTVVSVKVDGSRYSLDDGNGLTLSGTTGDRHVFTKVMYRGHAFGNIDFVVGCVEGNRRFWIPLTNVTSVACCGGEGAMRELRVCASGGNGGVSCAAVLSFGVWANCGRVRMRLLELENRGPGEMTVQKCYFCQHPPADVRCATLRQLTPCGAGYAAAGWVTPDGSWSAVVSPSPAASFRYSYDEQGRAHPDGAFELDRPKRLKAGERTDFDGEPDALQCYGLDAERGFRFDLCSLAAAGRRVAELSSQMARPEVKRSVAATPVRAMALLVHPDELSETWIDRAARLGVTTLSIHPCGGAAADCSLEDLLARCRTPEFRRLVDSAWESGLQVEYEAHVGSWVMPRSLFQSHPEYFRMDKSGVRTNAFNFCVSNPAALAIVTDRVRRLARGLYRSSPRHFLWLDDVKDADCRCEKCREYSASDQQMIVLNRMLAALREVRPDAQLAYLAYLGTMRPPERVCPTDGIFLEFAPFTRVWDRPVADQVGKVSPLEVSALLRRFGSTNARVLEYWFDNSLFSKWRKPEKQFALQADVFASDVAWYAAQGFGEIASFACFLGPGYEQRWGVPDLSAAEVAKTVSLPGLFSSNGGTDATTATVRLGHDGRMCFSFKVRDATPSRIADFRQESDLDAVDRVELYVSPTADLSRRYYCLEMTPEGYVHDYAAESYRKFDSAWTCRSLTVSGRYVDGGYEVSGSIDWAELESLGLTRSNVHMGIYRADFAKGGVLMSWLSALPIDGKPDFHRPGTLFRF